MAVRITRTLLLAFCGVYENNDTSGDDDHSFRRFIENSLPPDNSSWQVVDMTCSELISLSEQICCSDTILVTDNRKLAALWKERGGFCIGVDACGYFPEADVAAEELYALEEWYLRMCMDHHEGRPFVAAITERLLIRESVPDDYPYICGMAAEENGCKWATAFPEDKDEFSSYIRTVYDFFSCGLWTVCLIDEPDGVFDKKHHTARTESSVNKENGTNRENKKRGADENDSIRIADTKNSGNKENEENEKNNRNIINIINGRIAGWMGLQPERAVREGIEAAYIVDPKLRKMGIGREGMEAIIDFAEKKLGIPGFVIRCTEDNKASRALAESLGFKMISVSDGICLYLKESRSVRQIRSGSG